MIKSKFIKMLINFGGGGDPYVTPGSPLDDPWMTPGSPLGHPWMTPGSG